jgi:hypothetical protein
MTGWSILAQHVLSCERAYLRANTRHYIWATKDLIACIRSCGEQDERYGSKICEFCILNAHDWKVRDDKGNCVKKDQQFRV